MVRTPEDHPWSNHRCNALGVADPVIAPHPLYLDLAGTDEARQFRYRGLFADAIPQDMLAALRDATNGGFVLDSQRFQKQIATMVGRRTWPGTSGRPRKKPADINQLGLPI